MKKILIAYCIPYLVVVYLITYYFDYVVKQYPVFLPPIMLILILALIASLLYIIPFISFMAYPFALVAGLLCNLQIWIISAFA